MALIAITVYSRGKIRATIMGCSQKRYEEYLMNNEEYEYTVSGTYFRKYLEKSGCTVELKNVEKPVVVSGTRHVFLWNNSRIIDLRDAKEILEKVELSYSDFIDDYAKHLKSL